MTSLKDRVGLVPEHPMFRGQEGTITVVGTVTKEVSKRGRQQDREVNDNPSKISSMNDAVPQTDNDEPFEVNDAYLLREVPKQEEEDYEREKSRSKSPRRTEPLPFNDRGFASVGSANAMNVTPGVPTA